MIRAKVITLFFMLMFFSAGLFAQNKDSVQIKTYYSTHELMDINADSSISVDSSLDLLHEYNPGFTFNHFGVNTGIFGSPYRNVLFELQDKTGFNPGLNSHNIYLQTTDRVKFFDTYTPYSEIFYVQGGNELQKLKALHTRNITPFWNVTIQYSTNNSSQFYGNQTDLLKNKIKNLGFTSSFKSKNGNYKLFASFINNKLFASDNGGIDDTAYHNYSLGDKFYANVYLEEVRTEYLEKQLFVKQSLKIAKAVPDSLRKTQKPGGFFLLHTFQYQKTDVYYHDDDINVNYFKSIYLNNELSDDSIVYSLWQNEFHLLAQSSKQPLDKFQLGARHVSARIFQNGHDSAIVYFTGLVDARKNLLGGQLVLKAEYVLSGSIAKDYSMKFNFKRRIKKTANWFTGAIFNRNAPAYIMTLARTNHLQWQNNFNPTIANSAFTGYENHRFKFKSSLSYSLISNLIYLNEEVNPLQLNSSLSVIVFQLKKNFKAGHFHFNNHLALQYSSNDSALALPLWAFNHLTYFEGDVFKGNMAIQIGFSVRMMETYYADGMYAPFSLFYRQQTTQIQAYPLVDVFVNARVKRAKGFVKYEHVNYGFPQGDYFIVNGYPYKQRSFVFGIVWLFFD